MFSIVLYNMTSDNKPENTPETQTESEKLQALYDEAKNKRGPEKGENITAAWRYKDNGKYNSKSCDPDYDKKYYHAHLKGEHLCAKCMCVLASRSSLLQHQRKSVKCAKLQEMLRLIELENKWMTKVIYK